MPTRTFTCELAVHAPVADVREALAALAGDLSAHDRFLVSAEMVSEATAADGTITRRYRVRDQYGGRRVGFGFDYDTQVTLSPTARTEYDTRLPFGIRLRTVVAAEPAPDGTIIRERVETTAPRLLAGMVHHNVETAQAAILHNLKARLENQPPE
ncbi:MAG: hypothetical protein HOQ24_06665 [Mycobacteriaceae bacterium]|nr:hypothetical protein [Mycobacteriaceae bacterium]